MLERLLADRAADSGLDVVAVASSTTDYAKVLRRTSWHLAPERSAHLLTLRGMRGASAVSGALGPRSSPDLAGLKRTTTKSLRPANVEVRGPFRCVAGAGFEPA